MVLPAAPTKRYALTIALTFLVGALAPACAKAPPPLQKPEVTLVGVLPLAVDLFEQRYEVRLRIFNPNRFDVVVDGVRYEIEFNDQVFARGLSDRVVTVQRQGTEVISVEAISTLADIMRQLQAAEVKAGEPEVLRYRVSGALSLRDYSSPIAFDHRGEIRLPAG